MNDTLAILSAPLMSRLVCEHRLDSKPLLALAFGITTCSAMSPIGDPQNLLVVSRSFMAELGLPRVFPLILIACAGARGG